MALREWNLIVTVPTQSLRDDLILAVAEAVAALTTVPRLSFRDIRVLEGARDPSLALVIRGSEADVSAQTIRAETEATIRQYAAGMDLSGMSVAIQASAS